jgi:hypothetical protein
MHEVAETRSSAFSHFVLTATSFSEVCDRRQFSIDWSSCKPSIVEIIDCTFGIFLIPELDINIADQMISQVVAYVHFFNFSILVF